MYKCVFQPEGDLHVERAGLRDVQGVHQGQPPDGVPSGNLRGSRPVQDAIRKVRSLLFYQRRTGFLLRGFC